MTIRWGLIEQITSWTVIALLAGWLYYLTEWTRWLDGYTEILRLMIEQLGAIVHRTV